MSAVISINNIRRVFVMGEQQFEALKGVSFDVNKGEFVAIMGASGSGKSTCMNIIGCLDPPTSGQYFLDGLDVGSMNGDQLADIRNKKLGFVFQGFNLLARTAAVENVELPLIYAGINSKERRSRAMAVLEEVGLKGKEFNHSSQLSGGQQQRVAIARALVNNPSLLLADEPTGNLDSSTTEEIMNLFTALNHAGITIIMVTHEHDVASFATRQITFRDGYIISDNKSSNKERKA
ncbi:MAG: ABC transporter ATP-binding protein [Desulfuromonadaceae bacterium]|nr:ABC transporter ATP-binding protein [Desulfuromonadaceae bacterium]MDD2855547.1 ABC transporter ATP-binding protein [Desulfuromonadaceae bacterium]